MKILIVIALALSSFAAFAADEGFKTGLYGNGSSTVCGIRIARGQGDAVYLAYDRNPGSTVGCSVGGEILPLTCESPQVCSHSTKEKKYDSEKDKYVTVTKTYTVTYINATQFMYSVKYSNETAPSTQMLFTRWGSSCE